MKRSLNESQVGRYAVVVNLGFLLDLLVATTAHKIFGLNLFLSAATGLVVAIVFTYQLHKNWTFQESREAAGIAEFGKFVAVAVATLGIRYLILLPFEEVKLDTMQSVILFGGASGVSMIYNYFATKNAVFSSSKEKKDREQTYLLKNVLTFLGIAISLFWTFSSDFHTETYTKYSGQGRFSEALVVGRMTRTEVDGFFSNYRLLGWVPEEDKVFSQPHEAIESTYQVFSNEPVARKIDIVDFLDSEQSTGKSGPFTYRGNAGLQGDIFVLGNYFLRALSIPETSRLTVLHRANSLLLAIVLSLFTILVWRRFGVPSAVVAFSASAFSPWLAGLSGNLYWMPSLLFLPMLYTLFRFIPPEFSSVLHGRGKQNPVGIKFRKLDAAIIFILVLINTLTGFEFITCVLFSVCSIVIAFPLLNKNFKAVFASGALASMSCLASVIAGMGLTILLIAPANFGVAHSFQSILNRISYRLSYNQNQLDAGVDYSFLELMASYHFDKPIIDIFGLEVNAAQISLGLIFLGLSSLILNVLARRSIWPTICITAVAGLAYIGSVSWIFVAKGHAAAHPFIDYIIFSIPYLLIAPVLFVGAFSRFLLFPKLSNFPTLVGVTVLLVVSMAELNVLKANRDVSQQGGEVQFFGEIPIGSVKLYEYGIDLNLDCRHIDPKSKIEVNLDPPKFVASRNYRRNQKSDATFNFSPRSMQIPNSFFKPKKCRYWIPYDGYPTHSLRISQTVEGARSNTVEEWAYEVVTSPTESFSLELDGPNNARFENGISLDGTQLFLYRDNVYPQKFAGVDAVMIDGHQYSIEVLRVERGFLVVVLDKPLKIEQRSVREVIFKSAS